jgi:hypothetical protein
MTPDTYSMESPLKLLANTVEEFRLFKQTTAERYKTFMEGFKDLSLRYQTSETNVRRLESQNASLKSENDRLNKENARFLRDLQLADASIRMAVNDFNESRDFLDTATRNMMPSNALKSAFAAELQVPRAAAPAAVPSALPAQPSSPLPAAAPLISLKQSVSTLSVGDIAGDDTREAERGLPRLVEVPVAEVSIQQTEDNAFDPASLEGLKAMEHEIEEMLGESRQVAEAAAA